MAFTFNPHTDRPTGRVTNPPLEDYPYFEGAKTFEARASDYSPLNAWLLSEIALLGYARQESVKKLFDPEHGPALPGFAFRPVGESENNGCFILHNSQSIITVFRGTRVPGLQDPLSFLDTITPNLQDVVTDVSFAPADFGGGRVHGGILDAYQKEAPGLPGLLRDMARDGDRAVWFTGHSLGGALATVAAADFGDFQGLYTYGCPRVGDANFAAGLAGRPYFRFVHHDDFVPRLPPPLPLPALPPVRFRHAGTLVFIDRNGTPDPEADPDSVPEVLAGVIDWQDVFLSVLKGIGSLGGLIEGGLKTHLLDVEVPPNAVTDHAPVYYTLYLKEAQQAARS